MVGVVKINTMVLPNSVVIEYTHPDGKDYYCRNPASGDQCSDVSGIWGARKQKF